jgi:uncharacterized protein YebE (UPF0316 family)
MELLYSALFIMVLRIIDVTVGVIRTLMVVQGKKYTAGILGFIEVTIWAFAIRHIMLNLDNLWNLFGYSTGFALGNIFGITIEQKFGSGFVQIYVVSMHYTDKIADALRKNNFGVTILPGEGGRGGVAILVLLVSRKRHMEAIDLVESIDAKSFITVQPAFPYRGYIRPGK